MFQPCSERCKKPLVTTFQIRSTNAGIVHEHVVMQENEHQNVVTQASFIDRRNDLASDVFDVAEARSRARQIEQEVRNSNRRRAIANERTFAVLERTTGEILRQDAAAWWQWWDDYNDIYTGEEPKPTVYRQEEYVSVEPPPVPRRTSECFQAGTTVWTETGPTPIESVQPGGSRGGTKSHDWRSGAETRAPPHHSTAGQYDARRDRWNTDRLDQGPPLLGKPLRLENGA